MCKTQQVLLYIGWRLVPHSWGKGLATEGAKACLNYGFSKLGLKNIYAVAPQVNIPSQRVMQKIGMQQIDLFDHPKMPGNEYLNPCVLYKK